MNLIPQSLSRAAHRSLLKINGHSPTILVVSGVVGLAATAVLAAKATRNVDPLIDSHKAQRDGLDRFAETNNITKREYQKGLLRVYTDSAIRFTKLYGPTVVLGVTSASSILVGHKILRGRHLATLAAYSGLMDQFQAYRGRVAQTLGEDVERGIYDGAYGQWEGKKPIEQELTPVFENDETPSYLRPWFDETNRNYTKHAQANYYFLKSVQAHMNHLLQHRGHVFLNDVLDALGMERSSEGSIAGWLYDGDGDDFIDFGFMASVDPHTVAFKNGVETTVRLNFNIDGTIWDRI